MKVYILSMETGTVKLPKALRNVSWKVMSALLIHKIYLERSWDLGNTLMRILCRLHCSLELSDTCTSIHIDSHGDRWDLRRYPRSTIVLVQPDITHFQPYLGCVGFRGLASPYWSEYTQCCSFGLETKFFSLVYVFMFFKNLSPISRFQNLNN